MPMTVNVAGQVGQIKLSLAKALWPLFETVINSIQSLEDSNVSEKKIIIDALRSEDIQLKTDGQGNTVEEPAHFVAFVVTDNGNGFNTENYTSFLETIFYKGIMPSEKILDFPVDCNFLTGSVNL